MIQHHPAPPPSVIDYGLSAASGPRSAIIICNLKLLSVQSVTGSISGDALDALRLLRRCFRNPTGTSEVGALVVPWVYLLSSTVEVVFSGAA